VIEIKGMQVDAQPGLHTLKVPVGAYVVEIRHNTRLGVAHVAVAVDPLETKMQDLEFRVINEESPVDVAELGRKVGSWVYPNGTAAHAFLVLPPVAPKPARALKPREGVVDTPEPKT
jgi:hypothetical protein